MWRPANQSGSVTAHLCVIIATVSKKASTMTSSRIGLYLSSNFPIIYCNSFVSSIKFMYCNSLKFPYDNDVLYVAYHYPYTYSQLMVNQLTFEKQLKKCSCLLIEKYSQYFVLITSRPISLLGEKLLPQAASIR